MSRALELAARGLYTTDPNPRVGCIIVSDDQVVGEGWHQRAGEPHAEVIALREAGSRATGATAYVTLEPCSHQGRTPPCANALIAAGVRRVVAATTDPFPAVSGRGFAALQQAGVEVLDGLMTDEARLLNVGFFSRLERQRPWVRMKIAASLDGRTALQNGESQWITGAAARRDGHRWRARSSAILTGVGTINQDDPSLTVRLENTMKNPLRVVADSHFRIARGAQILNDGLATAVVGIGEPPPGEERFIKGAGEASVDLPTLLEWLAAAHQVNELHVEAGATLNGALLSQGLVDELLIYQAATVLGAGKGMFSFPDLETMAERINFDLIEVRQLGPDIRLRLQPS